MNGKHRLLKQYLTGLGNSNATDEIIRYELKFLLTRPCAYKTFFMLNSAEHEISKMDKSNLINLLDNCLTCGDFH